MIRNTKYISHLIFIVGVSSWCNGESDGLRNRCKRVRNSDKYPWERYEPPYPASYGLNTTTTTVLRGEWLWH